MSSSNHARSGSIVSTTERKARSRGPGNGALGTRPAGISARTIFRCPVVKSSSPYQIRRLARLRHIRQACGSSKARRRVSRSSSACGTPASGGHLVANWGNELRQKRRPKPWKRSKTVATDIKLPPKTAAYDPLEYGADM